MAWRLSKQIFHCLEKSRKQSLATLKPSIVKKQAQHCHWPEVNLGQQELPSPFLDHCSKKQQGFRHSSPTAWLISYFLAEKVIHGGQKNYLDSQLGVLVCLSESGQHLQGPQQDLSGQPGLIPTFPRLSRTHKCPKGASPAATENRKAG